jgi:membrane protease YdiL (CAAX protease family)
VSGLPFKYDDRTERKWDIYTVLGILVIPSLASGILSNFEKTHIEPLHQNIYPVFATASSLLLCAAFLRRSPWKIEDHGLDKFKAQYLAWGIFSYLLARISFWIYQLFEWKFLSKFIYAFYNQNERFQLIDKPLIPFVILQLLLNSILEEFTIRGVVQTHLTELNQSQVKGIIFANLIFASYHVYQGVAALVPIFILGLSFSLCRVLFKSLWPGIIGHTIYNLFLFYPYFAK